MNSSSVSLSTSFLFFSKSFFELTKARLAISVVFSSVVGYLLAVDSFDFYTLILLSIGGYCMVGASNSFNQIIEKDIDVLMDRTKNRPIPSKKISVSTAFYISIILTLIGIVVLYKINPRTALFGAISIFIYTCLYTPLKTITPLSVFVGAFPGAIPFMLGWVAATNNFGIESGTLFMIQFFWQFPHFWAIAWFSFDDYGRAGYNLLPSLAKNRSSQIYIITYTIWMIIAGILPVFHITGELTLSYLGAAGVLALGLWVLSNAIKLLKSGSDEVARKLMFSSIGYLTGMQIIYVIDRYI